MISFPFRQAKSLHPLATRWLVRLAVAATTLPAMSDIGHAQTSVTLDATSGSSTIPASYTTSGGLTISLGFFGDYLVVGGGGAAGGTAPGGGGGGQVLSGSGVQITSATNTVVVGSGGAFVNNSGTGATGGSSSFLGTTAIGGGGGNGSTGTGGTSGSGFTGGSRSSVYNGGGGGQTARGGSGNSVVPIAGSGGSGFNSTITGSTLMYGFGGSGGGASSGASAQNGDGTITSPRANSGGGGRRISGTTPGNSGNGTGAAGIVILRYAGGDATGVTGGTAVTGTGSAAGFMLQQFTTSGTTTLAIDFDARLGATLTGTISGGSDGMTFNGPGRLTLAAENTYTGATTVSAGTLAIGNGGTTGSVAGDLVTNAATIFNRSDSVSYAGVISGTGSITKQGGGNLVLTGTSSHTGATFVAAGRLSVNGALGGSAVTVLAAAELGGSGSIGGPVSVGSGGTLAPGNSIDSLAGGATSFASGSTFAYEFDSSLLGSLSTAADLLVVSGNLDIASGSLLSFTDIISGAVQPFVERTTVFAMINYSGTWNGGLFTLNGHELADGDRFSVGSQQWQIDYNYTYNTASPSTIQPLNYHGDYLPSSGTQTFVAITAVPEPSTLGLLGVAALGLACNGYTLIRHR